nr:MAG TPA: hypothetical protein [Caudoviricetes sp.]
MKGLDDPLYYIYVSQGWLNLRVYKLLERR